MLADRHPKRKRSKDQRNCKSERIFEHAAVGKLEVVSWHGNGVTEINHENP
jgi:hypothetical protein